MGEEGFEPPTTPYTRNEEIFLILQVPNLLSYQSREWEKTLILV